MANDSYIQVMRVSDFKVGDSPIDITDIVRANDANAVPRILCRIEATDAPSADPKPKFFSIARTCAHRGCNILVGGPWGSAPKPLTYFTVEANDVVRAVIECPCHGTRYDLTNGQMVREPESGSASNLRRFETVIKRVNEEDHVFVAINPSSDDGSS
jgi:nitrite reductase/ring-hydroxylating ferredoxin subunit